MVAFHLVVHGNTLDLGSLILPTPKYFWFVGYRSALGGVSALLFAIALAQAWGGLERFRTRALPWSVMSDTTFIVWTSLAALIIPLAVRAWVLQGAPVTDDEAAYRFSAHLLATGRLWVSSPPMKEFFDQNFMINDGRFYPVYFLGWPALMVPGIWFHATGFVNPMLSAATIWPLFRVIRHLSGPTWARRGIVLFLTAPFVQMAAATELSHTSCLMALTWALYFYLRSMDVSARARHHLGLAASLAVAFFIRPASAFALGLPLVIAWLMALRGRPAPARDLFAFVAVAVPFALLFVGILWVQNGSPWVVGYARYMQYITENAIRFTTFRASDVTTVTGFDFSNWAGAIAKTVAGIFRLNFDLFGWPSSFVLLLAALPALSRRGRVVWAMTACYALAMLFQRDWGIDTFGPVHAFELALPLIVLTILGAQTLRDRVVERSGSNGESMEAAFPAAILYALIVTACLGFVPIRFGAVRQIAEHVNQALRAPERQNLHHAVVFAPLPFAPPCPGVPSHFVVFHPVNDPDLRNDVLWVNQLTPDAERELVELFPGRTGYVMRWTDQCQVSLAPLEMSGNPSRRDGVTITSHVGYRALSAVRR